MIKLLSLRSYHASAEAVTVIQNTQIVEEIILV